LGAKQGRFVVRKMETSHFWVGCFSNQQGVDDYFAEVWDEADEDRNHTPLSAFARDQGEMWYDHDFLEVGFKTGAGSIEELVAGSSYHEQWSAELARRAAAARVIGSNMFVFIDQDQIDRPRSVEGDGFSLHYIGSISYHI
jgi:hypothetical protein